MCNPFKTPQIEKIQCIRFKDHCGLNQDTVGEMLTKNHDKALEKEEKMTAEQLAIINVGKLDPKRSLEEKVDVLMTNNVVCLGAMLDTIVFK